MRKAEKQVEEEMALEKKADEESANLSPEEREKALMLSIKNKTAAFLCIQTQSDTSWGLLHNLMNCMNKLKLHVIDHRSWHPRGVHTTLVNEIYVKDDTPKVKGILSFDERILEIQEAIEKVINQPVRL